MKQSNSLNDGVRETTAVVHQRHVVSAEMVAVWCRVERHIYVRVDRWRYYCRLRYPTSDARVAGFICRSKLHVVQYTVGCSTRIVRFKHRQWRRLHGGTGGARAPPPLLQMAGHGGTVCRRTANKKLTKLYWPSRKRSPKRINCTFSAKKVEGHDPKKISGASRRIGIP